MKITLRQLQVFVAIATQGHASRAADTIGMTQSAASMALADLERQLGSQLFNRAANPNYRQAQQAQPNHRKPQRRSFGRRR